MTERRERRLLVAMRTLELEPLLSEIADLLDQAEVDDDPERIERTLTDGYAHALTLEAERTSLERQVLRLSLELDDDGETRLSEVRALARRLHDCDDSFERLRGELVRLKRRHSSAVSSETTWPTQTSPDLTA
jgi:hypothetical protein